MQRLGQDEQSRLLQLASVLEVGFRVRVFELIQELIGLSRPVPLCSNFLPCCLKVCVKMRWMEGVRSVCNAARLQHSGSIP